LSKIARTFSFGLDDWPAASRPTRIDSGQGVSLPAPAHAKAVPVGVGVTTDIRIRDRCYIGNRIPYSLHDCQAARHSRKLLVSKLAQAEFSLIDRAHSHSLSLALIVTVRQSCSDRAPKCMSAIGGDVMTITIGVCFTTMCEGGRDNASGSRGPGCGRSSRHTSPRFEAISMARRIAPYSVLSCRNDRISTGGGAGVCNPHRRGHREMRADAP